MKMSMFWEVDIIIIQIGNLFKDLGRAEEALNDFDKIIEINPLVYNVYFCRGRYQFKYKLGLLLER